MTHNPHEPGANQLGRELEASSETPARVTAGRAAKPDTRPGDRHKAGPIPFRPPAHDRAWLLAHAEQTGRAVNAILAEALALYRKRVERAAKRAADREETP